MIDRELLELAAKAAGHKLRWVEDGWGVDRPRIVVGHSLARWNPLEDDGDALRLAVAIPACIVIDNDMMLCGVHLNGNRGKYDIGQVFVGLDPAAATRRAIVRAAAAIGSAL